jgi:hypothetical protein
LGLGINAYLRPVNDIHVENKEIGGTGAARSKTPGCSSAA